MSDRTYFVTAKFTVRSDQREADLRSATALENALELWLASLQVIVHHVSVKPTDSPQGPS